MAINTSANYTLTGAQLQDIANRIKDVTNIANNALPSNTAYGSNLYTDLNTDTYVLTLALQDQTGSNLGIISNIDLPLETMVVNGSYNSASKNVVLELKSGSNVEFSVVDLISGLQSEINSTNKLDAQYINIDSNNRFINQSQSNKLNSILNISNIEAPLYFNATSNNLYANLENYALTSDLNNISNNVENLSSDLVNISNSVNNLSSPDWSNITNAPNIGNLLNLLTNNKSVEGAINELYTMITNLSSQLNNVANNMVILNLTTTDPGEDSPLADNTLLGIYE